MMEERLEGKKTVHVVCEVVFAVIIVALLCVVTFARPPFNRGFFCNDESIQKPYVTKQAVPTNVLIAVGIILPIIIIYLSDVTNYLLYSKPFNLKSDETKVSFLGCLQVRAWIYRMHARVWYFAIGGIVTVFFTNIGKHMVGRLRPHFLAVCKPNYSLFNCTDGKSFPSGHSSFSAYVAIFVCLYLQYAMRSRGIKLLAPVIQAGLVGLALFTALGRISDYFHHWSDVLAGLIIGTLVAFYMIFAIMDLKAEEVQLNTERKQQTCSSTGDVENYGATAINDTDNI
eukprot:gene8195-9072_t